MYTARQPCAICISRQHLVPKQSLEVEELSQAHLLTTFEVATGDSSKGHYASYLMKKTKMALLKASIFVNHDTQFVKGKSVLH